MSENNKQSTTHVRSPLWWDAGALHFGNKRRACPEQEVRDLEASLREALALTAWSPDACKDVGQRLWSWLHGRERWLRSSATVRPPGRPWRLEVGGALPELVHLPWELLHDRHGFFAARSPAFVPLRRLDDPRTQLPTATPPRHGLAVLFMAAAPPTQNPLHFEEEERRILSAVRDGDDIRLEVEESGSLAGLGERCGMLEDWSVVHLSCHGRAMPPELLLETDEGEEQGAGPDVILAPIRPAAARLLVVSACSSGEFCATEGLRTSLAYKLIEGGCAAVLAFGTKVDDGEAMAFAGELYRALAQSSALDAALTDLRRARASAASGEARTWGALRLFTQSEPGPLAAPKAERIPRPGVSLSDGYAALAGVDRAMPIAHPMRFVGRRRELQRALKALRAGPGVVLQGLGGVGKSSLAMRVLSRLGGYRPVTVIGRLDTITLVRALRDAYQSAADVQAVLHDERVGAATDDPDALATMLAAALGCPAALAHPALFVLDDADENLEADPARPGEQRLRVEAERCYRAVLRALAVPGSSARALVTTRSALGLAPRTGESVATLMEVPLGAPLQDQEKLLRRADRYDDAGRLREEGARPDMDATPVARRALTLTGHNPRLFALVHRIWSEDAARGDALLGEIEAYLQGGNAPTLPEASRDLMVKTLDVLLELAGRQARERLAAFAGVGVPVPMEAVSAALELDAAEVERWVRLGVVERDLDGELSVPRLVCPLLLGATPKDVASVRVAVWRALDPQWKVGNEGAWRGTAEQAHFVVQGCVAAKAAPGERERAALQVSVRALLVEQRTGEVRALSELVRSAGLETALARMMAQAWGPADREQAGRYLALAEGAMEGQSASLEGAAVLIAKGDALKQQGKLEEALAAYREAQSAAAEAEGIETEQRIHQAAVIHSKIGDILLARGEVDEALRSLLDDQLPVFEAVGDMRSLVVTLGQIADIMKTRGDLDDALEIRQEEVNVYQRLGDAYSLAVTRGQIAEILAMRGDLDEALRIRREDQLPVFKALGDVRSFAVTQGQIADMLKKRGDLDEALRIHQEEGIPVFKALGDVRSLAVTRGKITDILVARGEVDEALRLLREDQIPVFEALGDVHSLAMTRGQIAEILLARGEFDEALRIRRDEIAVYQRLGDARALLVARVSTAQVLLQLPEMNRERAMEIGELLTDAYREAVRLRLPEAAQIRAIAAEIEFPLEEVAP